MPPTPLEPSSDVEANKGPDDALRAALASLQRTNRRLATQHAVTRILSESDSLDEAGTRAVRVRRDIASGPAQGRSFRSGRRDVGAEHRQVRPRTAQDAAAQKVREERRGTI